MLHMYLAKGRNANFVIQSKWMVLMQHESVHGLSVRIKYNGFRHYVLITFFQGWKDIGCFHIANSKFCYPRQN